MIKMEERIENGLKSQPDRYIVERDEQGNLVSCLDKDSGVLHKKVNGEWIWIS